MSDGGCGGGAGEADFIKNLLSISKQLQKRGHIKEFQKEFESDLAANADQTTTKTNDVTMKDGEKAGADEMKQPSESSQIIDLHMEVFEDKDYDIEEVKFWNFISKSKGSKPNVIRTLVYKVPESNYVVKQCQVPKNKTNSSSSSTKENH